MIISPMKRFYFPYQSWECFKAGMYDTSVKYMDPQRLVDDCEMMLRCDRYLEESMLYIINHWVYASHQHLSNTSRNRQAWLGQAACCWAHGAPECLTKVAWNNLTLAQQVADNAVADKVIAEWEWKLAEGYWARVKNIS